MNVGKFMKIISLVLVICLTVLVGIYAANSVVSGSQDNEDIGTEGIKGKRINVLLLATDKGGVLTDTIMFASFDKKTKELNIISVPRDTRVQLKNSYVKINSVYGAGKKGQQQELIIEKVTDIIGMPVNYYAVIDPAAFRNIIDILGGVEINIPKRMYYYDPTQNLKIDLQPGLQVLNGAKAEQFCRFRSGYANADLGRIDAQQMFVKALVKQKLKPKYLLKIDEIFDEIKENIRTNIGLTDITKLMPILNAMSGDSVNTYMLPGRPQTINGASYYICDRAQTDALINEKFLNIEPKNEE